MSQASPTTGVADSFDPSTGMTDAADPTTGFTYASDPAGGVYAHDPRTGMVYSSDPATGAVYAADPIGGLYAFDPTTGASYATHPSTGVLYASDTSGAIYAADPNTGIVYGADPATGMFCAAHPSGEVYSHDPGTGMTYAADPTTGMVHAADPLGGLYSADPVSGTTFAADLSTGMLYFADAAGGVYAADPTTGTNYAANPSTGYVYSADSVSGIVYGADPATGAVWRVGVMPGDRPAGAALHTEGETRVYKLGASEPGKGAQNPTGSGSRERPPGVGRARDKDPLSGAGCIAAELYPHSVAQSHLYTNSLIELVTKVTDQGYRSDGIAFYGFALPIYPGALPLVRLSHTDGHCLYTTSLAEVYDALDQKCYAFDQTLCYMAPAAGAGLTSLYWLESEAQNDALFTSSLLELQEAAEEFGYTPQGIAGHVLGIFVPGAVSVYRLSKVA